jgi:hypothetical protein
LLNVTLNLVGGVSKRLAWQERKAESFTISPLHSGNMWSGYRGTDQYVGSTDQYGGGDEGIRLGTAMAMSGAAASPNCGYASSSVLTFLLALFNARLGWWLGNPGPAGGTGDRFKRATPLFAVSPFIGEAIGLTNDYRQYVYLSDGGHFENLGLYEAVLRRCRYVLAVDATADPQYEFTDLAGALRKIRIDLGIPIVFEGRPGDLTRLHKHQSSKELAQQQANPIQERATKYCALARIRYSAIDSNAPDGWLVYIKPTICGSEPPDVIQYESRHTSFPHESAVNQFFGESQFESYRMLGRHQASTALRNVQSNSDQDELTLEGLVERVKGYLST